MDIPRIFTIMESRHRIHNPFTAAQFDTLGRALYLEPEMSLLDLGSGSGEMLCTWARDFGISGLGVDKCQLFSQQAQRRAEDLNVTHQVRFIHDDATGFVARTKVDIAACIGATWIGGGVAGTIALLSQSLTPNGIILVGEPYWITPPTSKDAIAACGAETASDFLLLPDLLRSFSDLGYDVVEMVLADREGWDRYEAAKWFSMRRWLEENPTDVLTPDIRALLSSEPIAYAAYRRPHVGWGVFALMAR
jgi:SAM-dependent methyltransferase